MSRNIRAPENMPSDVKYLYGRLLCIMVCTDNDYNQLKLAEFYRIINKIQLPPEKRIQLINSIITKQTDFVTIFKGKDLNEYLDEHLNDQEKNIFRFSLMKDLIIIMRADYVVTNNEKELLEGIQDYFHISDEQLVFFDREYKSDRSFFDDTADCLKSGNTTIETVSTAAALGIPLAVLNYSETFGRLGRPGRVSGFKSIGKRRTDKGSFILGLATSILLGVATYKITKYILSIKKDEKAELALLVKEDIEKLHESTKDIIHDDIEYFTGYAVEIKDENNPDLNKVLKTIDILKRAAATLENTDAVII